MERSWWGLRYPCKEDFLFEEFGFSQTVLAFAVLAVGIVLSCIALIVERIFFNLKQRKNMLLLVARRGDLAVSTQKPTEEAAQVGADSERDH